MRTFSGNSADFLWAGRSMARAGSKIESLFSIFLSYIFLLAKTGTGSQISAPDQLRVRPFRWLSPEAREETVFVILFCILLSPYCLSLKVEERNVFTACRASACAAREYPAVVPREKHGSLRLKARLVSGFTTAPPARSMNR